MLPTPELMWTPRLSESPIHQFALVRRSGSPYRVGSCMSRMAPKPGTSSPICQRVVALSVPPVLVRSTNSPKMSLRDSLMAPASFQ